MIVQLKLFAAAKDHVGSDVVAIEIPAGGTIADLRQAIVASYPELEQVLRHAMFAINADYATDTSTIESTDEVACIPPVSGG